MKFKKLTLAADGSVATNVEQSIGQVAIAALTSPLDIFAAESSEFVSKSTAGMYTLIGVGVGAVVQALFPFVPLSPR
jgi:hypothetical protein